METIVKAKRIGGSIGIIIPRRIVEQERIAPEDTVKILVEKTVDLSSLWGRWKHVKTPTQKIMKEIDSGEYDYSKQH